MIGCDVVYNFIQENGFTPLNFVVHPELGSYWVLWGEGGQGAGPEAVEGHLCGGPGLPELKEEIMARAKERVRQYLKGRAEFRITRAELYWLHQICAKQARKGQVMPAEDQESLLTECAESRRKAWLKTTNMLSMNIMKRLYGSDEESVKARESFFHLLKTDASFPAKVRKGFDNMS